MAYFRWNEESMELEMFEVQHPTYIPLSGNRCWALLPTNLDWFCYVVDMPNFLRLLKRIGFYIQVDERRGSLPKVLDGLRTLYGANYLRLTGEAKDVSFEVRVFPDADQSILYIVVYTENKANTSSEIKLMVAADFEFHEALWACKGFTEDATQDYTGFGRKVNTPRDDKIRAAGDGSVFFVYDGNSSGLGYISSNKPAGWTLDRSAFSFETPLSGYRRTVGEQDEAKYDLELSDEETYDDSFCVFQLNLRLQPSQKETTPIIIGYQNEEDTATITESLKEHECAFEKTKSLYQIPLLKGVRVETPDPTINAQFNLYNVFIKMNEHRCGQKHAFLPAAHYYNWICDDFLFALMGYVYANDLDPLIDNINLFRSFQEEDGFIPNLPLWTEGPSWRERPGLPISTSIGYIIGTCCLVRFMRDREFAKGIFPSLKKAMECILNCEKEDLISPAGDWSFDAIDWPPGFGYSPQTYASVETYKSLMDLSELATWLGYRDYAGELRVKARGLRTAINQKLWMDERGYYRIGLPLGKVGKDSHDRQLFYEDMISWGSLAAVLWGIADKGKAERIIENIKKRLFTPYGLKFFDPPWVPSYTDNTFGLTYEAGRVQNGAYWQCWHSIPSLVRAEIIAGDIEEAFDHFLNIRLDNIYCRFKMREKGMELSFLRAGEWTDTDLTFPVTSIPYMLTAAFFNQTLLECILGVKVGYDEILVEPHLPPLWDHAKVSNLKIGDSEWTIEINGRGEVRQMILDGVNTKRVPITRGKHKITIKLGD